LSLDKGDGVSEELASLQVIALETKVDATKPPERERDQHDDNLIKTSDRRGIDE